MRRWSPGVVLLLALLSACHTAAPTATRLKTQPVARTAQSTGSRAPASIAPLVPISPTPKPTPLPSGHVSPLPESDFPSASPGGPTPTPVPAVSVPPLTQSTVLSNTLDAGGGSIGGIVIDPVHDATAVSGATITIRSATEATKVATLTSAADGTYLLSGISNGSYYVTATASGYTGDAAPDAVTLSIAMPALPTVNLVLVKL
ncbi:MAG TPA: prealbumin-like fold domain-containing protein [Oscillatoriaceae cyanobacterium]